MTLGEFLLAMIARFDAQIAAINTRIESMSTMQPGMTDVEAQAFAALRASVATLTEQMAGVREAISTIVQTQAAHAEAISGVHSRLDEQAQALATMQQSWGTLPELPALPGTQA